MYSSTLLSQIPKYRNVYSFSTWVISHFFRHWFYVSSLSLQVTPGAQWNVFINSNISYQNVLGFPLVTPHIGHQFMLCISTFFLFRLSCYSSCTRHCSGVVVEIMKTCCCKLLTFIQCLEHNGYPEGIKHLFNTNVLTSHFGF